MLAPRLHPATMPHESISMNKIPAIRRWAIITHEISGLSTRNQHFFYGHCV